MKKSLLLLSLVSTYSYSTPQYIDLKEDAFLDGKLDASYALTTYELLKLQNDFLLKSENSVVKGSYIHNDNIIKFTTTENDIKKHYIGNLTSNGIYQGTWYANDLESGDFQFILQSDTGTDGESCDEVKIKDPLAQSGVYSLEIIKDGIPTPVSVYCNMEVSQGGWTLVNTREKNGITSHTLTQELIDPASQKNHYVDKVVWQALKSNATQLMITDGQTNNYVVFDFAQLDSANCQELVDDLANSPVFHSEAGCSYTGTDYTYLCNPTNGTYFTTMTMYNLNFKPKERSGKYGTSTSGKVYYAPENIQIYVR